MITNICSRHSQYTVLALALTALACGSAPEPDASETFRLQGTELSIVALDDALLAGPDMVGAELEVISGKRVKIASYERDAADSELAWYVLTYEGENICGGDTRGLFLPGLWDETGARVALDETPPEVAPWTFSCATGVLAQCAMGGYKPWISREHSDLHQICARLAPDDCGDDLPRWTTRDRRKNLLATIADSSDLTPRLLCRVPVRY